MCTLQSENKKRVSIMSKVYMWLYEVFNSIANYFWKKAVLSDKKKLNVRR